MLLSISHLTRYTYETPVFLEPHTIRLRPRSDVTQTLNAFDLTLFPEPAGRSDYLDLDGNCVTQVWFNDLTTELQINTNAQVDTLRSNPFDFLPAPTQLSALESLPELRSSLHRTQTAIPRSVEAFARTIAHKSDGDVMRFLLLLNETIAEQVDYIIRATGAPQGSDVTLREGRGACRDVAVLFMDCCRVFGLPARFVSGYSEGAEHENELDLHAWAEAFLPGGGWRGFDPSTGVCVADHHVPVAAAYTPPDAAPVTGTIRGNSSIADLYTKITLSLVTP